MPPPPDPHREEVLIATLGLQPQVVTTALDLLLAAGRIIAEVVVIHTTPPHNTVSRPLPNAEALERAVAAVDAAFAGGTYRHAGRNWPLRYRRVALVGSRNRPIFDIRSADDAASVFRTIHAEVRDRKRLGQLVHLSIAGGRKSISVYGMAVAQLLFDHQDHLWHLISTERFLASGAMHPTAPADAALVPVPVLSMGMVYLGPLADLLTTHHPDTVLLAHRAALASDQRRRCQRFLDDVLTPEERRLAAHLLHQVLTRHRSPTHKDIAADLILAERTIRNRFADILLKLRTTFDLGDARLTSDVLIGLFAPHYFDLEMSA
ncbi:MAG: hypothetical protein IT332_14260 [Ardenticatenales bacterium]|nr:hypothetical protein [Ardenticatenales bacterium]